ncbi:TonB-dependent receptor [Novosphingobium sp. TH158]|uniref:TonB-dependent receptor n=1 Tax=Novosphingobium sp. TH158 TaxID=2067455 RepID=UPI000C7CF589|nr:TonB-dependent receptor [Novosphingobium sp. TH158]PLK24252.1 TonB-dependent receptor [Novosphingobium sp. TH158]
MKSVSTLRFASLAAIASALIAVPGAAHATIAVGAEGVTVAGAQSADAVPADEQTQDGTYSSGLTEIVVTATKRETNLQKTPIAISVLAPDAIKDRHVQSLIDMADGVVPSLRVATFESRQTALTIGIRGIVPADANQTARDQGVGVYIDGVYLGRQQGLNAALFDIQRVEVLRGPQGTLFGRNAEGGALNIVTRKPSGEFGGRATAGFGNFGSYNGEIHVDLPAVANISVKLDGLINHQDATVTNPLAGQTGWNYRHNVGGRVTALWKPFDGFSVEVSYDKAKGESTPLYSQLINYNPNNRPVGTYVGTTLTCPAPATSCIAPLSPLVVVTGENTRQTAAEIGVPQQPSIDRTEGVTGTLKYTVAPGLELRSITAWRSVGTDQWDNSGGAHRTIFAPNANFSRYSLSNLRQDQFSQEFQAVGSMDQLEYAVGLYYFTEEVREFAATPSTNKWNATGTGYTINDAMTWQQANWSVQRDSNAKAKSYAAFAQATWSPRDNLHLTVGGRYTKDEREGTLTKVQNKPANFPFTFENSRFDPMVTLAMEPADGVNLYAKYSTGYRAGGANARSQTFAAFGPESVKAYELGAKLDLLDRRLRLNLAGYIMDRKGTQIDFDNVDTNPTSPTFNLHTQETRNAPGVSKIRGVEAELTARPVDGLTLGASYAYTHVDVPAIANPFLPGNPLTKVFTAFTPKHAASGYIDYDLPINDSGSKLRFHIDGNYASEQYSFQDEDVLAQPSFIANARVALVDLPMGNGGQLVTFSVWARNLFDETHYYRRSNANNNTLGAYANFNAPRTFGGDVTINF